MTTAASAHYTPDPAVIVASANAAVRQPILEKLQLSRIPAWGALGGADAIGKLESSECQLLLLDRKLPDLNAEDLQQIIHERFPGIDVLMLDDTGRPLLPQEWRSADAHQLFDSIAGSDLESGQQSGDPSAEQSEALPGIVGRSSCMQRVQRMVRLVARHNTPVLITGPTGTGKEMVAGAIHALSPRAHKPLVTINCAAIPEALLEAELFGYLRGAFTGAVQSHMGRIHSANGGTLFLDEIGDLPPGMQAKLLRFIDQGEIQRLGSSEVWRADVRIIAATNADLIGLSRQKLFREDLYYRLSVFPIELPPLAQRRGDVQLLAQHFLSKLGGMGASVISPQAANLLELHAWPGNVRELQHVIERALILAEGGPILPEHLAIPQDRFPGIEGAERHYA